MLRAPLLAVVALFAVSAVPSAGSAPKANERVLVVLASTGSKPFTVAEVERAFAQAKAFIQRSSFGQVNVDADVTPWLTDLTAHPSCSASTGTLESVFGPARLSAAGAGFDTAHYDTVVYALPDAHCGFFGATFGHQVMLTREPTLELLLHELGHTFGLGHAMGADCTDLLRCGLYDTGDVFSPMGSGSLDYSAYEKALLGWMPPQPHVTAPKRYVLAPATARSRLAQALVVDTTRGSWWIEYRSQPFRGLVFRFVDSENHSAPYSSSAVLILKPTKKARPWIVKGESYRIPSSWRVTLTKATATQAEVRFRP
ncbi:MAG: hypothetical protein ACJ74B_09995 [Gaiellaceae bacterium]